MVYRAVPWEQHCAEISTLNGMHSLQVSLGQAGAPVSGARLGLQVTFEVKGHLAGDRSAAPCHLTDGSQTLRLNEPFRQ